MKAPRRKYLGKLWGLRIYLVDGAKVRNELDVDFTCGGTEAIYSYIAHNEVWIDDGLRDFDRTATLLHEIVERDLMMKHGMSYDTAHDRACAFERGFRQQMLADGVRRYDPKRVGVALARYRRDGVLEKVLPRPIQEAPGKLNSDIRKFIAKVDPRLKV